MRRILVGVLVVFLGLSQPLLAVAPDDICEYAAAQVASESGVPADILGALTLTETGRRRDGVLRPWAWAVNAEGAGTWFDDPAQALGFAQARVSAGRHNVDFGCFQINYRWHGQNFASLGEMFDPLANARYAAQFLRQLYAQTGDWRAAAGAFHSRRPEDASRYLARFDEMRAHLQSRGFQGMTGGPDSYKDFNDLTAAQFAMLVGARIPGVAGPRRAQVMLLGAPLGSGPDDGTASLAVMGQARGPLLVTVDRGAFLALDRRSGLLP